MFWNIPIQLLNDRADRSHTWCQLFIGRRRRQHTRSFRGGRAGWSGMYAGSIECLFDSADSSISKRSVTLYISHLTHQPEDFFKWQTLAPFATCMNSSCFFGVSWNRNCKKRRPGILSSFSLWIKAVSIIPSPRAPRNTGTPSRRLLEWNLHVFPRVWDWKQFCIQWLILSLKNWSFTGQHSGQKSYKLGSFYACPSCDPYWSLLCWEPHNLCT